MWPEAMSDSEAEDLCRAAEYWTSAYFRASMKVWESWPAELGLWGPPKAASHTDGW